MDARGAVDRQEAVAQSERRQFVVISLALLLVTLTIYAPAVVVPYDFVDYDDTIYVTGHPVVSTGLSVANLRWAAANYVGGNWHPVTVVSHMLDVELYGLAPRGHHLSSIVLHAVNGVLLFWVMRAMTARLWPSALVAALFAWHPLRVESVAWISERKDVLSAFFFLLALLAYARFARRGGWASYAAMTVCFALGLLSKPMLVTFPCVLLLVDVWPLGRVPWLTAGAGAFRAASVGRLIVEKLPLVPLSVGMCIVTLSTQAVGIVERPLAARLASAAQTCWSYLGKAFFPYPLYLPYLKSDAEGSLVATLLAVAGLVGVTVAALVVFRRRPYFATGWFWYLGMLVPVIGVVQVGEQSMADRYTYLPLVGVYWIVAWALLDLAERSPTSRRVVVGAVAVVLGALCGLSAFQVTRWRDTRTLFEHTIRYSPRNYVAYSTLAIDAFGRGDYELALQRAASALDLSPAAADPLAVQARSLARTGRTEEALVAYRRFLAMNPNNLFLANELARILATCEDSQFRSGREALKLAIQANTAFQGENPQILDTLAAAYAELGEWPAAVAAAEQAHARARAMADAGDDGANTLARDIAGRRDLYRHQRPYRVPGGVWDE